MIKNLKLLTTDIQNIAEAIEAVLKIDVTIVDDKLVRIAGTGIYLDKIGETIQGYSAFKKCISDKVEIVIDNPSVDDICKFCDSKYDCEEFAEVCCPIIYDNKIYGVIGLIAFNKFQQNQIIENRENLMNFIRKMADLISNKIEAEIKSYELQIEKKKLETLVDNMDKAIVSVDRDGNIDKYSPKFLKIFKLEGQVTGKNIGMILDFLDKKMNLTTKNMKSNRFIYTKNNHTTKGIYSINEVILGNELKGYVINFIDKVDAIKNYNRINEEYKITFNDIIGESEVIKEVKKEGFIASNSTSTVLIRGESGTGKELFARAIHNCGNRKDYPFIAVNCAAIPDNLLESELFGYEEGAFTGAKKGGKLGKFEIANKGTIFLDEIGDMSLHLQAKLLRVLQEKELNKIGSKDNINIDVRIIAATNKNLEEMILDGSFREDLYYRLNVIPLNLPSLKDRKEDINLLIEFMIKDYSKKLNKNISYIQPKALNDMINYSWPGNIRQLQNVIEYSINKSEGEIIRTVSLPNTQKIVINQCNKDMVYSLNQDNEIKKLEDLEKEEIIKAIEKYKMYKKDKDLVAKALGISRATLYRKIEKYDIK